jgi:hypothetical protein
MLLPVWVGGGIRTRVFLLLYQTELSRCKAGEGFEPSTHKVGKQHSVKQHVMMQFIITLWRYTETLIRSLAFCFFLAFFRHSREERFLVPINRDNIFIKEHSRGLTQIRTEIPFQAAWL